MPEPTAPPRLAQARTRSGRPKDPLTWNWTGLSWAEVLVLRRELEKDPAGSIHRQLLQELAAVEYRDDIEQPV